MKILTIIALLLILNETNYGFSSFINKSKIKNILKKEFDNKIDLISYETVYAPSIVPLPQDFKFVILYDKKEDFYFTIAHDFRGKKKDSREDIIEKIKKSIEDQIKYIDNLKEKAKVFKKYYNKEFFIIYDETYSKNVFITFLDIKDFDNTYAIKEFNKIQNYLKDNQKDIIEIMPKKYTKYFKEQISKNYYSQHEKTDLIKDLDKSKKEEVIYSSDTLNSILFRTYFKISYETYEDMEHRVVNSYLIHKDNQMSQARGYALGAHVENLYKRAQNIDIDLGVKMRELIKDKYFKEFNKELKIDFLDSYLNWEKNILNIEVYDFLIDEKKVLKTHYLKYDFLTNQFIEHKD